MKKIALEYTNTSEIKAIDDNMNSIIAHYNKQIKKARSV